MFLFFFGFVAGWWACNWYVQNDRSFERAFLAPAQEALSEATENGNGRSRAGRSPDRLTLRRGRPYALPMLAPENVKLDFAKFGGLVLAVVQHHETREVLMVGVVNEAAWAKCRQSGLVTFWSRTREQLWTKGETSGNFLRIKRVLVDCDEDTLLFLADPVGPTCHTGEESCFYREIALA
jgi:phosphoribosyl-AMP cyclohydrolase